VVSKDEEAINRLRRVVNFEVGDLVIVRQYGRGPRRARIVEPPEDSREANALIWPMGEKHGQLTYWVIFDEHPTKRVRIDAYDLYEPDLIERIGELSDEA